MNMDIGIMEKCKKMQILADILKIFMKQFAGKF